MARECQEDLRIGHGDTEAQRERTEEATKQESEEARMQRGREEPDMGSGARVGREAREIIRGGKNGRRWGIRLRH